MANSPSALKRARQAAKRNLENASKRSLLRTSVKRVLRAIKAKDKDAATTAYKEAMPIVDSMVNKGIIHKNKANRHKSRLNKHIRAL